MDGAHHIPDATDWLNTPLKDLAGLENALHCQVCKEFYDTPMITSCSHTFCSKCIRTSLSADGKCPLCRTPDQASKLRNNWALQEVVAAFLLARPATIEVARKRQAEDEVDTRPNRPGKRKRTVAHSGDVADVNGDRRTTRSKSRRIAASQDSQPEVIDTDDTDDDGDFEPDPPLDDGRVECPLGCGKRMTIEAVEPHLDRCEEEKRLANQAKPKTPLNGVKSAHSPPRSHRESPKPRDLIAELNYSLMKESALKRKFDELGIPSWGAKPLMVKRHTEWVNLWNANGDSDHPRSKRELLHDLDTWERTQGGKAPNPHSMASAVMRKDFDGTRWASKNRDEFSRLIADARRMKAHPAVASGPSKEDVPTEEIGKPAPGHDGTSSPFFERAPPDPSRANHEDAALRLHLDDAETVNAAPREVEMADTDPEIDPNTTLSVGHSETELKSPPAILPSQSTGQHPAPEPT